MAVLTSIAAAASAANTTTRVIVAIMAVCDNIGHVSALLRTSKITHFCFISSLSVVYALYIPCAFPLSSCPGRLNSQYARCVTCRRISCLASASVCVHIFRLIICNTLCASLTALFDDWTLDNGHVMCADAASFSLRLCVKVSSAHGRPQEESERKACYKF